MLYLSGLLKAGCGVGALWVAVIALQAALPNSPSALLQPVGFLAGCFGGLAASSSAIDLYTARVFS